MHKSAILLLALATVSAAFAGRAYADAPDGIPKYIEDICAPLHLRPQGHLGTHSLTLTEDDPNNDIPNPLSSGTTVTATASATPGAGIDHVVFVWYDVTNGNVINTYTTPIGNPNPGNLPASVSDSETFTPGMPTQYEVTACFQSKQRDNQGTIFVVTKHLNVGSFMVLPESAIGALALASAPIAALGFYLYRKNN